MGALLSNYLLKRWLLIRYRDKYPEALPRDITRIMPLKAATLTNKNTPPLGAEILISLFLSEEKPVLSYN